MNWKLFRIIIIGTLIYPFLGGTGCNSSSGSLSGSGATVTTCNIPSDQQGTISGAWPVTPIPMAVQQGNFSSSDLSAVVGAVNTWNTFFTASKQISVLSTGPDPTTVQQSTIPLANFQSNLCAQPELQGTTFSGNIVIYKMGQWPTNYPAAAIALTNFCTQAHTPYPKMYDAVMLLNYQSFFVQGARQPDLQSVVLHELGHVLGLNHSCEAFQKTGTPNCNESGINPDYLNAIMFPSFTFDATGTGNVRRTLDPNDEGRANCLYPATN